MVGVVLRWRPPKPQKVLARPSSRFRLRGRRGYSTVYWLPATALIRERKARSASARVAKVEGDWTRISPSASRKVKLHRASSPGCASSREYSSTGILVFITLRVLFCHNFTSASLTVTWRQDYNSVRSGFAGAGWVTFGGGGERARRAI